MNQLSHIPIGLDRLIEIDEQILYLCGVIYHVGDKLNSGHYYSEISVNCNWYEANDTTIRIIQDLTGYDPLRNKVPYIVLYRTIENPPIPDIVYGSVSSKMQGQAFREIEFQKKKYLKQI